MLSFDQVCTTMLRMGMRTSSIFNSQHVATCCNRVANDVAPNDVAQGSTLRPIQSHLRLNFTNLRLEKRE